MPVWYEGNMLMAGWWWKRCPGGPVVGAQDESITLHFIKHDQPWSLECASATISRPDADSSIIRQTCLHQLIERWTSADTLTTRAPRDRNWPNLLKWMRFGVYPRRWIFNDNNNKGLSSKPWSNISKKWNQTHKQTHTQKYTPSIWL